MNTSSLAAPPVVSEEAVTSYSDALVEVKSSNSATVADVTEGAVSSQSGTSIEMDSCSSAAAVEMLMSLSPKPIMSGQRSRKRKTESVMNITSSPYKKSLMEKTSHTAVQKKTKSKQKIEKKWLVRKAAMENVKSKPKKKVARVTPAQKNMGKLNKPVKRRGCGIKEGSIEDIELGQGWIACDSCCKWYHDNCAEDNGVLNDDYFSCRACIA